MSRILAIDPGISGALAFYKSIPNGASALVDVLDMPLLDGDVNPHLVRTMIEHWRPSVAIIEHVHPHPKEGVSSVWRFAAAFTVVCTVVRLANLPMVLVTPAKWKKEMGLRGGPDGKEQSRRLAIDMFPSKAHVFQLKKHHGRAEAALIAVYASRLSTMRNITTKDTQDEHDAL